MEQKKRANDRDQVFLIFGPSGFVLGEGLVEEVSPHAEDGLFRGAENLPEICNGERKSGMQLNVSTLRLEWPNFKGKPVFFAEMHRLILEDHFFFSFTRPPPQRTPPFKLVLVDIEEVGEEVLKLQRSRRD